MKRAHKQKTAQLDILSVAAQATTNGPASLVLDSANERLYVYNGVGILGLLASTYYEHANSPPLAHSLPTQTT